MTTKPKLKKIPLPKGLPELPKGAAYLGFIPLQRKRFIGWYLVPSANTWTKGETITGGAIGFHYAAATGSAIAREILGEPAKPVAKRKAAKKTITLRKLQKNVKPGTKVVCVESVAGAIAKVTKGRSYTVSEQNHHGSLLIDGWWWNNNHFRLAPAKPAAKKASAARREAIHDCVILEPRIPFVSPPEAQAASNDPVNHPSHYTQGGVECIDAIQSSLSPEEFRGYLRGCAMKYLWRGPHKGNYAQDLAKAKWYLDRLAATIEKEKP